LTQLLDVDVPFRRLISLLLHTEREHRTSDRRLELGYMLFGYCRSLDEYRDRVVGPYGELMAMYQLPMWSESVLLEVGKAYVQAGGMLPPPQPKYLREDGKLYYGDYVHNGNQWYIVEKVGLKYVHCDKGVRCLRRDVKHFDLVPSIPDPRSVADHMRNELIRLHNLRSIPNAHMKPFADVAQLLYKRSTRTLKYRAIYQRRSDEEQNELKRQAQQQLRDGIRYFELKEQAERLKQLSVVTPQDHLDLVLGELQRLEPLLKWKAT
jgi:hypothetical protein